jgi:hypothetical protein
VGGDTEIAAAAPTRGQVATGANQPAVAFGSVERIEITTRPATMKNGALTIMDVRANANDEGPAGWYGVSSVDAAGRLHTLVRCPQWVDWCGDPESIDWSPDGRRLAFGVTSFGGTPRYNGLHVVNLRTGRDRQLVRPGQYHEYNWNDIDWAPGGRRLAYTSDGTIALINADGSGRTVLDTGTAGHDLAPSWSPDGHWIAFVTRHDGVPSIYAIRSDGSQRRVPFRHQAEHFALPRAEVCDLLLPPGPREELRHNFRIDRRAAALSRPRCATRRRKGRSIQRRTGATRLRHRSFSLSRQRAVRRRAHAGAD